MYKHSSAFGAGPWSRSFRRLSAYLGTLTCSSCDVAFMLADVAACIQSPTRVQRMPRRGRRKAREEGEARSTKRT